MLDFVLVGWLNNKLYAFGSGNTEQTARAAGSFNAKREGATSLRVVKVERGSISWSPMIQESRKAMLGTK